MIKQAPGEEADIVPMQLAPVSKGILVSKRATSDSAQATVICAFEPSQSSNRHSLFGAPNELNQ